MRNKTMNRLNAFEVAPDAMKNMLNMEAYIKSCYQEKHSLEYVLVELVKLRVSQINQCTYCIQMHTKDAKLNGESEERLSALAAWKNSPFFTEKEKLALQWAEANTLISTSKIDDDLYQAIKRYFSDEHLVDLTLLITTINAWNRIALSFKM